MYCFVNYANENYKSEIYIINCVRV